MLLDKLPALPLRQSLASAVRVPGRRVLAHLFNDVDGLVVPVILGVGLGEINIFIDCYDGGSDDDALDIGAIFERATEDGAGALYGGDDHVVRVFTVKVKRRSQVLDGIDTLNGFVECTILCEKRFSSRRDVLAVSTHLRDILHHDELQLITVRGEQFLEMRRLVCGANGTADREASFQELLHGPNGNVTVGTGDEDLS